MPRKNSQEEKDRMLIGRSIAAKLGPPIRTRDTVGKLLVISQQMVNKIECNALYKISLKLRQSCRV